MSGTTSDTDLVSLVDALVEAIDTDRADAVDRVREALAPFGGSTLFAAEVRLNGQSSDRLWALLADSGDLAVEGVA